MERDNGKLAVAKEFLADDRFKIKLHDLVTSEVRALLSQFSTLSYDTAWSVENLQERLRIYETACRDLLEIQALIGFWGTDHHRITSIFPAKRLGGGVRLHSGMRGWLSLRWYPSILLLYAGGIASVAGNRYDNFYQLLLPPVDDPEVSGQSRLVVAIGSATGVLHDVFKDLPDHAQRRYPRSDYLHVFFQSFFDELLFLGPDYDTVFDRFELLFALEHSYVNSLKGRRLWGPPGRFAWKFHDGDRSNPLASIIADSEAGAEWSVLKAGFFGGSLETFKEIVKEYRQVLVNAGW
jgi:hypothetical protein